MKLWRCTVYSVDDGTCLSWHASKREADIRLRVEKQFDKKGTHKDDFDRVEPVDVPTKKAGLIEWLNSNLDRDNG